MRPSDEDRFVFARVRYTEKTAISIEPRQRVRCGWTGRNASARPRVRRENMCQPITALRDTTLSAGMSR